MTSRIAREWFSVTDVTTAEAIRWLLNTAEAQRVIRGEEPAEG